MVHPLRALMASNLCAGRHHATLRTNADAVVQRFAADHRDSVRYLISVLDRAATHCAEGQASLARTLLWEEAGTTAHNPGRAILSHLGNLSQVLQQHHDDLTLPLVLHSIRTGLAELIGYRG